MAQLALGLAGAAVGTLFGAPGIGFAIGSALGGALFAPDVKGPRLADLKAPQGTYGAVIPYVEGHPRLPGVIIWSSDKREVENTTSAGKGGPEQTSYTYVIDVLIALAENDIGAGRRVWSNGELVWSVADDSSEGTVEASSEAPWSRISFYNGASDQLPDPTYEAAVGTANAPAYRGLTTVLIENLDLGGSGQLPILTFECGGVGVTSGNGSGLGFFPQYEFDAQDSIQVPADYVIVQNGVPIADDLDNYPSLGFSLLPGNFIRLESASPEFNGVIRYDVQKIINGTRPPPTDYVLSFLFQVKNVVGENGIFVPTGDVFEAISFADSLTDSNGIGVGFRRIGELTYLYVIRRFNGGGASESTLIQEVAEGQRLFLRLGQDFEDGFVGSTRLYIRPQEEVKDETELAFNNGSEYRYIFVGSGGPQPIPVGSGIAGISSVDIGKLKVFYGTPGSGESTPLAQPTLQQVVERQCERAGIPAEYVDATDLATRYVSGMPLTQIVSPRNVIDTLARGYFFVAVESEVLRFKFLGTDAVETVPYVALGAALDTAEPDPLAIAVSNDTELPVQVYVKYINSADDYQDGSEQSFRFTNSPGNTATTELALVFTPTEAKRIADVTVLLGKSTSTRFGPFPLSRDYAHLEPTDPVILTNKAGNTYRARLTTKNESQGVLTFEAVLDDATILNSAAETAGSYTNSTVVTPKVATEFEPLDIPLLRDADDATGIYWGAGGASGWPGAAWLQSADDATFERVASTERNTVIGTTVGTLSNWAGGQFFDEATVLRVNILYGQLASYSRDDVLNNNAGAYLVGNEVIQARNATLVSAGVYDLTGLLRGRRGTEWAMAGHVADERFVVLNEATLNRQALNVSDIGRTLHWKAVTFGRLATTADSESLTFAAVSQKPFSPVDLRGARDSGDLVLTWRRRTRLSTNFHAHLYPLGEATEAYQVLVYADNTYTAVKRAINSTAPSATYSSADQTTDFGSPQATLYLAVHQVSATAGRGTPLQGAI